VIGGPLCRELTSSATPASVATASTFVVTAWLEIFGLAKAIAYPAAVDASDVAVVIRIPRQLMACAPPAARSLDIRDGTATSQP
jgi:hypothetical protein